LNPHEKEVSPIYRKETGSPEMLGYQRSPSLEMTAGTQLWLPLTLVTASQDLERARSKVTVLSDMGRRGVLGGD
jgi:hypothetical protein